MPLLFVMLHLGSSQTCPQFRRQFMNGFGNPDAWHSIWKVAPIRTVMKRTGLSVIDGLTHPISSLLSVQSVLFTAVSFIASVFTIIFSVTKPNFLHTSTASA
ncbi:hypothetical protein BpHYR1_023641 [Brachionus plicatilis]|uniref:Uncharacterized protein n=1 Tax=Brachionus plicatilis TaxID=10195 RepID=A0A3M7RU68_BRAPC|nr:hypothetical protein BpHYR1_023641 [Brachionus plicatilis]